MSADNGVFVLKTQDGFRITRCSGSEAESLTNRPDYPEEKPQINKKAALKIFGEVQVLTEEDDALAFAHDYMQRVIEDTGVCEHGVSLIEHTEIRFPSV